jgi:hypothetical protein
MIKPHSRLDRLSSLREDLVALRAVKCRMSHERVIRAPDSMLPLVCSLPEGNYQRVGLCSPEVRAQRLGCSHTSARIKLENAIGELDLDGADKSALASSLAQEWNWLNNEIHLLDHRKGEAEKTLARILEETYAADDRARTGERLRDAEQAIREMERLHDEYVDRIDVLRDRVVTEMDRLIELVANEA